MFLAVLILKNNIYAILTPINLKMPRLIRRCGLKIVELYRILRKSNTYNKLYQNKLRFPGHELQHLHTVTHNLFIDILEPHVLNFFYKKDNFLSQITLILADHQIINEFH